MTATRSPLDPAAEDRLRRDLQALADQLLDVPVPSADGHTYISLVPARRGRWPIVAAAAVVAVLGVGTALAGWGGVASTSRTTGFTEASAPTPEPPAPAPEEPDPAAGPRSVEDADRALAAAIEALRQQWGAEFAPTVLDDVRADRAELEAAHAQVAEPAEDVPAPESDAPDQVPGSGFSAEGRLDGLRLTVAVSLFVTSAPDLWWVDATQAGSLAEPVPVAAEDVQVWSDAVPDPDGLGGSTVVQVFTRHGVVHIAVDHPDGPSPLRPEDAVAISRATFTGVS